MNASQIHLALTHVPVILSIIGLVLLGISLLTKNAYLSKTSFFILIAAGIFVIPVYLTGEGAEEIIEKFPGVSENIIEKHEQLALLALSLILISAVVASAALLLNKQVRVASFFRYTVLLLAFTSALTMAQTAHLGGQIRHTEIRSDFYNAPVATEEGNGTAGDGTVKEKDDD